MDELADFVLNYYREAGAIVEPPAYGVYEALLPDTVAARLGMSAYQRFAFDDVLAAGKLATEANGAGEVTHLGYGHPLVESLVEAARQAPACTRLYVNAVRLDKRGLADLARKALSFPNARLVEVEGQTESRALGHYVRFNFKAALITDEKREQLLSVLMDAQGGYAVKELAEIERLTTLETTPGFEHLPVMPPVWLPGEEPPFDKASTLRQGFDRLSPAAQDTAGSAQRLRTPPFDKLRTPLSRQALEGLLESAKRAALDELAEPLDSLQRRAARFLELDRARLEQYYDDMQGDLKRRLDRAADPSTSPSTALRRGSGQGSGRSSGQRRHKALEDKLVAVQIEREAKLADAEAKYRLRVELELINLLVIVQPRLVLPMNVENRTTTVARTVVWNPLLHRIEPLTCDVCGRASFRLFLCTGGHLAHEECLLPHQCVDCKRVYCHLCTDQMKACVVCDRPVCASSLNHCPTCGRGTCREHVGLCHAAEGEPARILPTRKRGTAEGAEIPPPKTEPRPEPFDFAQDKPVEGPEKVEAPPKSLTEKKPKKKKLPTPPAKRRGARAKRTPSTRRVIATGQKIEVYTYSAEPVITAFVIASRGRELARRTWELVEDGIAVWCNCEKGPFCRVNQTIFEPGTADEIEAQLQDKIEALRQEYQVPGKRVNFYYVLHDAPRPERRLLLRGQWKDDAALSKARTAFHKTYTQRSRQH
jgi:quinol monooxygenase YgiN